MIRRIATVGGLTLVSRLTGFVRDVVMAAFGSPGPCVSEIVSGSSTGALAANEGSAVDSVSVALFQSSPLICWIEALYSTSTSARPRYLCPSKTAPLT